ncbi:MAG: YncE family protein [Planctomycetaceae bacterium]|nr:YncE family protein [Planctomycetaceae bacterium]
MIRRTNALVVLVAVAVVCIGAWSVCAQTGDAKGAKGPLTIVKMIAGGGEGGWDLLTADPASHRVYVARGNRVMVFDVAEGKLVGEVPGVLGAHGVAVAGEHNVGFATNAKENLVCVFNLKTLKVTQKIKSGTKPDAIVYDPTSKKVYAFNGRSGDATIIDPADLAKAPQTLKIGGKLELGVADGAGHVYVNLEDKSMTVAIDSTTQEVMAKWSVAPGEEPTGVGVDAEHRRLFVGCNNNKMMVLDADKGTMLGEAAVGAGVDGAAFEPKLGLAVTSNGRDGTLSVVKEGPAGKFATIQTLVTAKGGKTVCADAAAHQFYVPCILPSGPDKGKFGLLVIGAAQ